MELTALKGIGSKTNEYFQKLGVHTQEELLEFFPRDYELFYLPTTVGEIGYQTFAAVKGAFTQELTQRRVKKMTITTAQFQDEVGKSLKVTWFNAPFMKDALQAGKLYILRGRISRKYGVVEMHQPKVFSPEEYEQKMTSMQPVYPLTKGLSSNLIANAVRQALEGEAFYRLDVADPLPGAVRVKYGLCKKSYAVSNLHFPESKEAFMTATTRMAFEEIFLFLLTMKQNEAGAKPHAGIHIPASSATQAFFDTLPFALTEAQKRVIAEVEQDMASGGVMNRLIQGDVGSGKTMVAIAALLNAAAAGYQGALMAPTEVLAAQHFETISRLLKEAKVPFHAALLTGSMSALEKKVVYDALQDGRIHILIGTHALFQEKVIYKNLGLVITDEQHRFGIKQREALAQKAMEGETPAHPHMLVMSATPIPRTLALILYGNSAVSVIDELPVGRKPIKNAVIDRSYKEQTYRFLEKEVAKGHQVYIICPLIEFSEGVDAVNVTDYAQMLQDVLSEDIKIGMLHGQMTPAKKNDIMERFAKGDIQVLVSTTVVEVGVDVPNATVMMVEDANRFGLAQLHQLRGRVGRGEAQSYCIFVCNHSSKEAMERLSILKTSNDGFEIAEKDLALRGPGEFIGIRQSGALSFRHFDIYRDRNLAEKALSVVNEYLGGKLQLTKSEEAVLQEKTKLVGDAVLL